MEQKQYQQQRDSFEGWYRDHAINEEAMWTWSTGVTTMKTLEEFVGSGGNVGKWDP